MYDELDASDFTLTNTLFFPENGTMISPRNHLLASSDAVPGMGSTGHMGRSSPRVTGCHGKLNQG